jgi:hypothetical protein
VISLGPSGCFNDRTGSMDFSLSPHLSVQTIHILDAAFPALSDCESLDIAKRAIA